MKISFAQSTDVWGVVLSFALRLDTLDRAALRDLRNLATVCRASSAALARMMSGERLTTARLRVRVHRLFGFRNPKKIEFRPFFPEFADDPLYAQAKNGVPLSLVDLSRRIACLPQGPAWVSWAEDRPRRLGDRKRKLEADQEAKVQRRRLLEAEFARRGLAFDPALGPVMAFCNGHLKTMGSAIKASQEREREKFIHNFVDARDALLGPSSLQQLASFAAQLRINLNPAWSFPPSWSAPRALGVLSLRHQVPAGVADFLEDRVTIRAGEDILRGEDLDPVGEALVWISAVRAVMKKYKTKYLSP